MGMGIALLARVGVAGCEWDAGGGGGGVVQPALDTTDDAALDTDSRGAVMLFWSTNGSSMCRTVVLGRDTTDAARDETEDGTTGTLPQACSHSESAKSSSSSSSWMVEVELALATPESRFHSSDAETGEVRGDGEDEAVPRRAGCSSVGGAMLPGGGTTTGRW